MGFHLPRFCLLKECGARGNIRGLFTILILNIPHAFGLTLQMIDDHYLQALLYRPELRGSEWTLAGF